MALNYRIMEGLVISTSEDFIVNTERLTSSILISLVDLFHVTWQVRHCWWRV